jgi:hypothetical protein
VCIPSHYHVKLTRSPTAPQYVDLNVLWLEANRALYGHKAPYVPKIAAEDTTLTVSNADGGKTTFPVVSGTEIKIHVPGIHYNRTLSDFLFCGKRFMIFFVARYWKDPHKFKPERFLGDWPKDAFFAFSQGISRFTIIL